MPTGHYERKPRAKRIAVKCRSCLKYAQFLPGEIRNKKPQFCSRKCRDEYRATRVCVRCSACSKPIEIAARYLRYSNFCSRSCAGKASALPYARWKDPDHIKRYLREYNKKNREQHRKRSIEWTKNNPEKRKEIRKRWTEKNWDRIIAIAQNRRAAFGSISGEEWTELKKRCGGVCISCHRVRPLTIDHIKPLSKGGTNTIENVQPLCKSCNSSKGAREVDFRPEFEAQTGIKVQIVMAA
jgi:5-methylcytosine-specific restriction endonuclease McrA